MSSREEKNPNSLAKPLRNRGRGTAHIGKNDENDLIPASKAVSMFPRDAIDKEVAYKLLIDAASTGSIAAACDVLVEELHVRPMRLKPPSDRGATVINSIRNESGVVWLSSDNFTSKKAPSALFKPFMSCNWRRSIFAIIFPKVAKPVRLRSGKLVCEPFTRNVMYGVKFSKSGVTILLKKYINGDLTESPRKKFRKVPVRYNWPIILKDLIAEAQIGRLSASNSSYGQFGFQAALEERILNLSFGIPDSSEGMSVSTARRQAGNLIKMNKASLAAAQRTAYEPHEPYGSDGPI